MKQLIDLLPLTKDVTQARLECNWSYDIYQELTSGGDTSSPTVMKAEDVLMYWEQELLLAQENLHSAIQNNMQVPLQHLRAAENVWKEGTTLGAKATPKPTIILSPPIKKVKNTKSSKEILSLIGVSV